MKPENELQILINRARNLEKKYNKLISQIRKQGVEFMVNTNKKNSIDGGFAGHADGGVNKKSDVSPRSPAKQMK